MKKLIINISLIIIAFIIYFLQSNFFNWFTISGIMPNVFIIFILFLGLFATKSVGVIYGIIIGIILDFLFGINVGINAVALGIVGFIAGIFDKNFSKDSRITIMIMVLVSTILFEVVVYALKYIILGSNIEIFSFIKILFVEVIFNVIITIIIYPLIKIFGYYIENEYKGNKVLTRYF